MSYPIQLKSLISACLLFLTGQTQAETLGLNFTQATDSLLSTDFAGLPNGTLTNYTTFTANWNNVGGGSGSASNLTNSLGASTGVAVSWTSGLGGAYRITNTTSGSNLSGGANPTMMKGYLDGGGGASGSTVTFTGLSSLFGSAAYKVIVFADGDNFNNYRGANYTIGGTTRLLEDSENVNFNSGVGNNANGLFQLPAAGGIDNATWPTSPNNSEGNYVTFDVTGDSFTLSATGVWAGDGTLRAPINGIEIVSVPEPSSMLLMLVPMGLILCRRRH